MNDVLLLIGRVLIALLFLMTVWVGGPSVAYLTGLGFLAPVLASPIAHAIEWIIVISFVLGIATRYVAVLGVVYVIIATAAAHRYWQVPPQQFVMQYTNFSKNLAVLGALLYIYVTGAGSYSIDDKWLNKRLG